MAALEAVRAAAHSGRSAASAVHTLRIAESRSTMLSHVTFQTLAYPVVIAPSSIGAFLVAFRIRTCHFFFFQMTTITTTTTSLSLFDYFFAVFGFLKRKTTTISQLTPFPWPIKREIFSTRHISGFGWALFFWGLV